MRNGKVPRDHTRTPLRPTSDNAAASTSLLVFALDRRHSIGVAWAIRLPALGKIPVFTLKHLIHFPSGLLRQECNRLQMSRTEPHLVQGWPGVPYFITYAKALTTKDTKLDEQKARLPSCTFVPFVVVAFVLAVRILH